MNDFIGKIPEEFKSRTAELFKKCSDGNSGELIRDVLEKFLAKPNDYERIINSPAFEKFLTLYGKQEWHGSDASSILATCITHLPQKVVFQNADVYEKMLCLLDLYVASGLEVSGGNLFEKLDKNSDDEVNQAFGNVLKEIQEKIKNDDIKDLNAYQNVTLEKLIELYNEQNKKKLVQEKSDLDQKKPDNATQKGINPIAQDRVKPFLEDLFIKQGLQFKAETDPANPAAIKYRVLAAPGAEFSVQADKEGKLSLSANNEAALVKMIELLAAKINENKDSKFVILDGDEKAMKIMTDACKRLGLEAVPKDYKNPDPDKQNKTKLTLEDENYEEVDKTLRIRSGGM